MGSKRKKQGSTVADGLASIGIGAPVSARAAGDAFLAAAAGLPPADLLRAAAPLAELEADRLAARGPIGDDAFGRLGALSRAQTGLRALLDRVEDPGLRSALDAAIAGQQATEAAAEWVAIESITPWPENPRDNDAAVPRVAASIKRFGWGAPILARAADRVIIAGDTRYKAARALGLSKVPVRFLELDPVHARLLAIADNKLGELAEWDEDALGEILRDLAAEGAGEALEELGFDEDELDELLEDPDRGPPADPGAGAPPKVAVSRRGEIYQLGPHRLMCGDATSAEDVAALLQGERIKLVFTDPPYGISYRDTGAGAWDSEKLALRRAGLLKPRFEKIEGDDLDVDALADFLRRVFTVLAGACDPKAPWYVWHASRTQTIFEQALGDVGYEIRSHIIWAKSRPAFNFAQYKYKHEPCYYAFRAGNVPYWYGDLTQTTLWDVASESGAVYEHPTQKPVGLAERAIGNSSRKGDVVFDSFLGSGSALIGAARTGRVCFGTEIDPCYCDVIRRRWTQYARSAGIDVGAGALDPLEEEPEADEDELEELAKENA